MRQNVGPGWAGHAAGHVDGCADRHDESGRADQARSCRAVTHRHTTLLLGNMAATTVQPRM